jgi:Bacterial TniB protein
MTDDEAPSIRGARAARAIAIFKSIRVSYGPQNALVGGFDLARMQALEIRKRRSVTGQVIPMPVLRTIAELGVGKTIGAQVLEAMHRPADPEDTRRPVLIATLDTTGLQISIPQAILFALGKKNWNYASKPSVAWDRAYRALREHDVQLVIFDEMNRASRRPSMGEVIGGDLMDMLSIGAAAVAFLGTSDANKVFNRVPALKDRMESPVVMKALDWHERDERAAFIDFLREMDEAMLAHGIVTSKAGLADHVIADRKKAEKADGHEKDTANLLWEVCRGRLRPLCLLLEEAVRLIHYDNERLVITHEILAQAVENHSIENEVISYNPFRGERPE